MTAIQNLTPEEISLIEIKRQQDALEKERLALERASRLQKDIDYQKKSMETFRKKMQAEFDAIKKFYSEFDPTQFDLVVSTSKETYKVEHYTNPEDPRSNNFERDIVWSDCVEYQSAHIEHKNKKTFIRVSLNDVNSLSLSGVRGVSSLRKYTKVKTILEKINEELKRYEREEAFKSRKQTAEETCVEYWSQKYPDATIEKETMYTGGYFGQGRFRNWSDAKNEHVGVKITLKNGVIVKLRYDEHLDKWCTHKVQYPIPPVPKGDTEDVVNQLQSMVFQIS